MTDAIVQWLLSAGEGKFLATVLISMLPVIELRGAVQFTVHKLACSQASIYRYIKKVKSQTE